MNRFRFYTNLKFEFRVCLLEYKFSWTRIKNNNSFSYVIYAYCAKEVMETMII